MFFIDTAPTKGNEQSRPALERGKIALLTAWATLERAQGRWNQITEENDPQLNSSIKADKFHTHKFSGIFSGPITTYGLGMGAVRGWVHIHQF